MPDTVLNEYTAKDSRFSKNGFLTTESGAREFCKLVEPESLKEVNTLINLESKNAEKTLPTLTLEDAGEDPVSLAAYKLGEGKLILKGIRPDSPEFASTLGHEIKHAEQDLLMLWHLCDKHGIGNSANMAERQAVQSSYEQITKTRVESSFFNELLQLRQGKELDSESNARAENLIKAVIDERNTPSKLQDLEGQQQLLQELYNYQSEHGVQEAVKKLLVLADLDETARAYYGNALFGGGTLSHTRIYEQVGDPHSESWNPEKSAQALLQLLQTRDQSLLNEMKKEFAIYASRHHEAEAFAVEERIKNVCKK